jgi:hypothetical protein
VERRKKERRRKKEKERKKKRERKKEIVNTSLPFHRSTVTRNIDVENCLDLLKYSHQLNARDIYQKSVHYFATHYRRFVTRTSQILDLPESVQKQLWEIVLSK